MWIEDPTLDSTLYGFSVPNSTRGELEEKRDRRGSMGCCEMLRIFNSAIVG